MDKEKIESILQNFSNYLESTVVSIKIGGIEKEATLEDQIEFIKSCWEDASEQLNELGIDVNY